MPDKPSHSRSNLSSTDRAIAIMLAIIWMAAGTLTVVLVGVHRHNWAALLIGILAIGYGVVWAYVAYTGRRLQWPARRR